MKFIDINKAKRVLLMVCAMLVAVACEDESKAPIVTFDTAGHGAYPRLVSETGDKLVNIQTQAEFDASQYGYTVEFIDDQGGASVAQYVLVLEYEDNDASNGDNSVEDLVIRTYTPADFTTNANGFLELANVSLTASQVATAAGISYTDLSPGDAFNIDGEVHTVNGDVFTSATSSSAIEGTAFRGHFAFQLPAACPSSIGGTYDVTTTSWCTPFNLISTTVDIVDQGAGVYQFSDWAFGTYVDCYGGGSASGDFTFNDVCQIVTINDGTDSFGDSWRFSSVISGNDWIITWENFTYNAGQENGVSTITFPGGVPFTLAP